MKIGCCAYSYRQYLLSGEMNLEDFIDTAVELGTDGVELTSYYFPKTDTNYLNSIKRYCFESGIDISGAAVGSKLTLADTKEREDQTTMIKEWLSIIILSVSLVLNILIILLLRVIVLKVINKFR